MPDRPADPCGEFDTMYALAQNALDRVRGEQRTAMLWGMLASLSSAIDGP